ncbi:MAG TPA: MltA domain-containing protein [Rhizomicrobium sp.]|nr:MltA domain-containing protein [Rhizomicrobium sp.]
MLGRGRLLAALVVLIAVAVALGLWLTRKPPEQGPLKLAPLHFSDLPGWSAGDPRAAFAAFQRSCEAMIAQAPETKLGSYGGTVADWQAVCAASKSADANAARDFFEQWFAPLEVSAGDAKDGLFTGYYEPELKASRIHRGAYRTPVYGLPTDLVSVDLGAFRPTLAGERIAGRVEHHALVPYATRAEIDAKGLRQAPVLFWADDPVAVFFLHIQGSGRVSFDDGVKARVAYAGENGHPYTAIGRTLIAEGRLAKSKVSLQTIREWLLAHPGDARRVMETDASFIFFKELPLGDPNLGAVGAANVALTPWASVAVDKRLHPYGVPVFVATSLPGGETLNRLYVAQDTGGAIRGPVRADIFFGVGDKAEALAGTMKQTGRMFVLLPKPLAARTR